ncbi:MAG: hypothetical protein ACRDWH_02940 [Acidimicrobiia bacterium]
MHPRNGSAAVLLIVAAVALSPLAALAAGPMVVNGGGTGTFEVDLDGDGDIDGSHFGLGVVLGGVGAPRGHFECLMAGNTDILGLPLMAVEGKVVAATIDADSATLGGMATINLANGTVFREVPFTVTVIPGGAGSGQLRLTVIGAFDGVAGDSIPGNGNYDLPWETVSTGQIRIHN